MAKIFDNIKGGANRVMANAGANAKALMEKTKINAVIDNLGKENKELISLLGQKVYDVYKLNGEVAIEDISNFIAEIDKRIEQMEVQKEELRRVEEELAMVTKGSTGAVSGGVTCESCGSANAETAKFCAKCGSLLNKVEE